MFLTKALGDWNVLNLFSFLRHFRVSGFISEDKLWRSLIVTYIIWVHHDFINFCFRNEVHRDIALHWQFLWVDNLVGNMILAFCCHFSGWELRSEFVISFLCFFDSCDGRFILGKKYLAALDTTFHLAFRFESLLLLVRCRVLHLLKQSVHEPIEIGHFFFTISYVNVDEAWISKYHFSQRPNRHGHAKVV